jgi:hypothetical protein
VHFRLLVIELAGMRGRKSGRACNPACLVRQVGGRSLQCIAGKTLLPRLVSDGVGHLLADFGSALDLFARNFAGLVLDEIAGLPEILAFGRCRREGGRDCCAEFSGMASTSASEP